jgi:hypothetical protein
MSVILVRDYNDQFQVSFLISPLENNWSFNLRFRGIRKYKWSGYNRDSTLFAMLDSLGSPLSLGPISWDQIGMESFPPKRNSLLWQWVEQFNSWGMWHMVGKIMPLLSIVYNFYTIPYNLLYNDFSIFLHLKKFLIGSYLIWTIIVSVL